MRSLVLALVLSIGCTRPNPEVCCGDAADCNAAGIPEGRTCVSGLVCTNHRCTEPDEIDAAIIPECSCGSRMARSRRSTDALSTTLSQDRSQCSAHAIRIQRSPTQPCLISIWRQAARRATQPTTGHEPTSKEIHGLKARDSTSARMKQPTDRADPPRG